ncbi:MAG: hypothetical protein H0T92_25230 [Pyrinomonadaceae bacterium]|nr:hypothetical protein [Pyrinomonadaceae bacterium]
MQKQTVQPQRQKAHDWVLKSKGCAKLGERTREGLAFTFGLSWDNGGA